MFAVVSAASFTYEFYFIAIVTLVGSIAAAINAVIGVSKAEIREAILQRRRTQFDRDRSRSGKNTPPE